MVRASGKKGVIERDIVSIENLNTTILDFQGTFALDVEDAAEPVWLKLI